MLVLRRSRGLVAVIVSITAVALVAVLAVRSDGRAATRATSNDGGAWLLNRDEGVVGHVNRVVREVTGAVRVADVGTDYDVEQAQDVVLVSDRTSRVLSVVDDRSHQVAGTVPLPDDVLAFPVDDGAVLVRTSSLAVWRAGRAELSGLQDLDEVTPDFVGAGEAAAIVDLDGTLVAFDESSGTLHRQTAAGEHWSSSEGLLTGDVVDMTAVGTRTVLLTATGHLVAIDEEGGLTSVRDDADDWTLQQPGPDAEHVVVHAADGTLLRVSLVDGRDEPLVTLPGRAPLPPIVHGGCVYGVASQPAVFGRVCGEDHFETPLDAAGGELRLRLVNGWIWINAANSGVAWIVSEDGPLERVDDWGAALPKDGDLDDDGAQDEDEHEPEDPDPADAELGRADDFEDDGVNDPPNARDDEVSTRVDRPALVEVLRNDDDPDGDVLLVSEVENLSPGDALVTPTADHIRVQVTPAAGFTGVLRFRYTITDGRGGVDDAIGTVDVSPADANLNRPPTAVTDVAATRPGNPVSLNVLDNDEDPDGDALVLRDVTGPAGSIVFSPDGELTFTPDAAAQQQQVELAYVVADDFGETAQGRVLVSIRLGDSNQAPDARNDVVVTVSGKPALLNVLHNDIDPDGDVLLVSAEPQLLLPVGRAAEVSLSPDGEFFFDPPETGTWIFSYTVSDGALSDIARIRVEVLPSEGNRPPLAIRDDMVIPVGGTRVVDVLANDGDPDGDVVGIVDWTGADGLALEVLDGGRGFRVTVQPGAAPRVVFRYSISDGVNEPVGAAVVVSVVDVAASDQPPIASGDVAEVRPGRVTTIPVLRNDHDPEGGVLTVVGVAGVPAGVEAAVGPAGAAVVLQVGPDVTQDFTFGYDVADEAGNRSGATVRVRIVPPDEPNRQPIARTDIARTVAGRAIPIDVLANDSDPDGDVVLVESIAAQPSNGTATIATDGRISYRPDNGFTGTDRFAYVLVDAADARTVGEVLVGVMPLPAFNRPPTAHDDQATAVAGRGPLRIAVLRNDVDPDLDVLTVGAVGTAKIGEVAVGTDGAALVYTAPARLDVQSTQVTFTYRVDDGHGNSDEGVVTVELLRDAPLVAPVAIADLAGPTSPGQKVQVDVLANDSDPDGSRADLELSSRDPAVRVRGGLLEITAGQQTSQHLYTITDADGLSATATVTLVVLANGAPKVEPLTKETPYGTEIALSLAPQADDPDGDELLFVCCDRVRGGAATVTNAQPGRLEVTFRPDTGFIGEAGFSYLVDDQHGHQVSGAVTVVVLSGDNRPPIAQDLEIKLLDGSSTVVELTGVVEDPDPADTLSFRLVTTDGAVTASMVGSRLTITADQGAGGKEGRVRYEVRDRAGSTDTGEFRVRVLDSDATPPEARLDEARTSAGARVVIPVLDNDIGTDLRVVRASGSTGGVAELVDGGQAVAFTPTAGFSGTATASYTIRDGMDVAERESTAQIRVSVVGLPGKPATPQVSADGSSAALTWTSPSSNGAPIEEWEVAHDQGASRSVGLVNSYTWDGLRTGTTYRFQVRARNEAGWGPWSDWSAAVTPNRLPSAPGTPEVQFADGALAVSWAPASSGDPITDYVLEIGGARSGAQSVGTATSYTWQGLSNGSNYQFRVRAVTAAGAGDFSAWSQPEHPLTQPAAPETPSVSNGPGYLDISWTRPADGGDPIARYEIQMDSSSGPIASVSDGSATNYRWSNLDNGDEHTFRVRAWNRDPDPGAWSPWSAVATACDVPTAASGLSATAGDGSATLAWSGADGSGCSIVRYEMTHDGGASIQSVSPSGGQSVTQGPAGEGGTYTGLTNGTSYTFQVRAVNSVGAGAWSGASNAVVPSGPPKSNAISGITADAVRELAVTWTAADPNGSPLRRYEVSVNNGPAQNMGLTTSHTFTGLSGGTDYCFRVRAVNDNGAAAWSSAVCARAEDVPSQVGAPSVTAPARGTLVWTWTAPSANGAAISGYEFERSNSGGIHPTTELRHQWDGLPDDTTRSGRVRACNRHGCGTWSSWVSGTTQPAATTKAVSLAQGPSNKDGSSQYAVTLDGFASGQSVTVECWDDANTTAFKIYQAPIDSSGGSTTYDCSSGNNGGHWVVAYDGTGWSAKSNVVNW